LDHDAPGVDERNDPGFRPLPTRSPYYERVQAAGARGPSGRYAHGKGWWSDYGRDPRDDYRRLHEGVVLWDLNAECGTGLRGPDALRFADYLCANKLSDLAVGMCRYTPICDEQGVLLSEAVVLRPFPDTVWISNGPIDVLLWAKAHALHSPLDVEVVDPQVPVLSLVGPLAKAVMGQVAPSAADLAHFRCVATEIAGVAVVVARTAWSGAFGYELYPLGMERALEVWDAVAAAGASFDLVVTGTHNPRAFEYGYSDVCLWTNTFQMTPLEHSGTRFVDLDGADFIGREALRQAREKGVRRRVVGLTFDETLPELESHWPVVDAEGLAGHVLGTIESFTLDRWIGRALVDIRVPYGARVTVRLPDGTTSATVGPYRFLKEPAR
jgi:aminomethyltransferase